MSEELDVLKTVARRLDGLPIPYMVTGSMAVNYYAVPRMTRDIDVVVELSPSDADRLCDAFRGDFYVDRDAVRRAVAEQGMFNLIHGASVIKVDFVVRKDSEYRREEFSRRRRLRVEDQDLSVVTPEDLIISKLDWARQTRSEVQLTDVRNLLASVPELDEGVPPTLDQPPGSRCPLPRGAGVTDTSPDVARRFRELLLRRSGEERLKMGCSMHAAARALVVASVLEQEPQASPITLRRALFLRFYGHEFDAAARERILAALERLC